MTREIQYNQHKIRIMDKKGQTSIYMYIYKNGS